MNAKDHLVRHELREAMTELAKAQVKTETALRELAHQFQAYLQYTSAPVIHRSAAGNSPFL